MASEKKGSKGRLLYLFDWHGKSRKKLFSNKLSESFDVPIQGKENLISSTVSQDHLRDAYVNGNDSLTKGSGSFSSISSSTGDEGYGSRPSVVARLMGLESLPTSSASETSSVFSHEPHTLGSSYYPLTPSGAQPERHPSDYSNMASKLGEIQWSSTNSKSNVMRGRSIERFQTEVLPPKSAKPISVTHHKLLSPIKSPGFVPTKDAAYIMEAASRIIDSSHQPTALTRTPSFGATSSPMRLRDLKEKMEAVHRSSSFPEPSKRNRQSSMKQMRGIPQDGLSNKAPSKTSMDSEMSRLGNATTKGRTSSLSDRGKGNVRRKDGSTSRSRKDLLLKEQKQGKLKQTCAGQSNGQTRSSTNKSTSVLRQNTEKQNSMSNKDRSYSKASLLDQQSKKSSGADGCVGSARLVNSETGSKKVVSTTVVTEKRPLLNRMKNISRNKDFAIRNKQLVDTTADTLSIMRSGRAESHDFVLPAQGNNKKGMDVISFVFNSPIKKSGPTSQSSSEITGTNGHANLDSQDTSDESGTKGSSLPLTRLNLIGGNALSLLLEQKLKELTEKVESVQSDSVKNDTSDLVSSLSGSVSAVNTVRGTYVEQEWLQNHEQDFLYDEAYRREDFRGDCCSSKTRDGPSVGNLNQSVSECSFSNGSCISSCGGGKSQSFIYQSEEEVCCTSTGRFHSMDDEKDMSDTASSVYYEDWDGKHTSASHSISEYYLSPWELHYVRQIIHCAGLKESVVDESCMTVKSNVFDQVENEMITSTTDAREISKLGRKLLFDCLNDCLCERFENISVGSYKAWTRWIVLLQREDWLAEELYKEIIVLEDMGSLMVDELVEKDMGIQYGGWLDFEIEALEEGTGIVNDLVESLIHELVIDLSFSLR